MRFKLLALTITIVMFVTISVKVLGNDKKPADLKQVVAVNEKISKVYYVGLISNDNQDGIHESVVKEVKHVKPMEVASEEVIIKEESVSDEEVLNSDVAEVNDVDNERVIEKNDDEVIDDETIDNLENEKNDETQMVNKGTTDKEAVAAPTIKNGFYDEDGGTYYYENDVRVTGVKQLDGVNNYFNNAGKYLGVNNVKVIDVSHHQGEIDWDLFARESDCYGVIVRIGYYHTLDRQFERNISALKRLNIPYGIYLFSYASGVTGAVKEADFTNDVISKYQLTPTLGIYYDIESWQSKSDSSDNITKKTYDDIITTYVSKVNDYVNGNYKVKVYSGRWYAMNRLGITSKSYVDWVAEYNKTCKYDGDYSLWQYTSNGSVPGIDGRVDISYLH